MPIYLKKKSLNGFACPRRDQTAFRGIYKEGNRTFKFDFEHLSEMRSLLQRDGVRVLDADYKSVIDEAEEGDFVFLDPPYVNTHLKVYGPNRST
jgi:site-specific DNA-adenine methylase